MLNGVGLNERPVAGGIVTVGIGGGVRAVLDEHAVQLIGRVVGDAPIVRGRARFCNKLVMFAAAL